MKRLHRSMQERKIAGVCGGLGILLYLVLWLVVPGSAASATGGEQPGGN